MIIFKNVKLFATYLMDNYIENTRFSNKQLRELIGLPKLPYSWADLQEHEDKKLKIKQNLEYLIFQKYIGN